MASLSRAISFHSQSPPPIQQDGMEAEQRLQEAEERLLEAIEELHRPQRRAASGDYPPCDHEDSCVAHAIGNLCQSFLLANGVRVGVGIILRAFKLFRGHSYSSLLDLKVALFCACMGCIMYYLEHEPDTMAPFLRGLICRFLTSRISNPSPPSNRSSSYTYLQTLGVMKKPKLQETQPAETSASEEYNLESIPGL